MIALARPWADAHIFDTSRIASSLGLFAGCPADSETCGGAVYACLAGPRARPARHWRAARSQSGAVVLLHGWIDNADELERLLGVPARDPAALYGAAVDRWGDDADRRVVGSYAAIVDRPTGGIRLSRSPWSGPPLAFVNDGEAALVASVSRVIFATGYPEKLRRDMVIRTIAMQNGTDDEALFEGVRQVPHGSIVHLAPGSTRIDRWYDPCSLAPVRLTRDADYVERARELLDDAIACALATSRRPGIELSGGLDSALLCDRMLNALPEPQRLPSFTFHPQDGADLGARHEEDDERHFVRAFAEMHPRLDPVFVDNRGARLDSRAREMFLAAGKVLPAMILLMPRHGVLEAARDHGCDWLFGADYGNLNVSNSAAWAMPEFLATGRWRQAWRLASISKTRPAWWQILTLGVMPRLPPAARSAIRRVVRRTNEAHPFASRLLRRDAMAQAGFGGENQATHIAMNGEYVGSKKQWLRENYFGLGLGAEMFLALEQVFGMRRRDVTAYRPLTEFCLSIPTEQLVHDGERRLLARRMAEGRIPEQQRNRKGHAFHNADWHARMTPHLGELRKAVEAMARQPELAGIVDIDSAMALLDSWPERPPEPEAGLTHLANLQFFLPATLVVSQYVDFVSGRNTP